MIERIVLIVCAMLALIFGCFNMMIFVDTFIPRVRKKVIERVQKPHFEKSYKEIVSTYNTTRWLFFALGLALIGVSVALAIKLNIG